MYPLLDIYPAGHEQALASITQGTTSVLRFERSHETKTFVDRLLISGKEPNGPRLDFQAGNRQFRVHRHIDSAHIALVSDQPTILRQLSIHDNLELIANRLPYAAGQSFSTRVTRALEETGLFSAQDLSLTAEFLPWSLQVEINFLQAWLSEPQWIIFDSVFGHPECQDLMKLPLLFRQRFPLRAITYLQPGTPLPSSFNAHQEIIL